MKRSERDSRALEVVAPGNQESAEAEVQARRIWSNRTLLLEAPNLKPGLPGQQQKESKLSQAQPSSHRGKTRKRRKTSRSNRTRKLLEPIPSRYRLEQLKQVLRLQ